MNTGYSSYQFVILEYLKRGFWIQVTHDLFTNEVWRCVTDGDNDMMSVSNATIKSLLKKGKIVESGSWTPSLQIDITNFKLLNDAG